MVGGTGYSTYSTPGHSNRIFSLKFHPLDSNTIVSGERSRCLVEDGGS